MSTRLHTLRLFSATFAPARKWRKSYTLRCLCVTFALPSNFFFKKLQKNCWRRKSAPAPPPCAAFCAALRRLLRRPMRHPSPPPYPPPPPPHHPPHSQNTLSLHDALPIPPPPPPPHHHHHHHHPRTCHCSPAPWRLPWASRRSRRRRPS